MKDLAINTSRLESRNLGYADVSLRFEWLVVLSSLWLFAGLYLDGWAHNNIADTIDSFFTPWHGVLYSGYAVTAAVLGLTYLGNIRKGYSWLRALPSEYMLSWLGAIIFAVVGNLDFIWHSIFGFEKSVEALVSPSHLILAVGGVMMMSGPLRMAWRKSAAQAPEMHGARCCRSSSSWASLRSLPNFPMPFHTPKFLLEKHPRVILISRMSRSSPMS
jgi:hypothetical protein